MHKRCLDICFLIIITLLLNIKLCSAQDGQPNSYNIVDFKAPSPIQSNTTNFQNNYSFSNGCNAYLQNAVQNLDNAKQDVEKDYNELKAQLIDAKIKVKAAKQYEDGLKDRLKLLNKQLKTLNSAKRKVQYNISMREKILNAQNLITGR